MMDQIKPDATESPDHETFRLTILQLEQSLVRGRRSMIAAIALLFSTIVATPILLSQASMARWEWMATVSGSLLAVLGCNAYSLMQYRDLTAVRGRLNELLGKSVKQRIRADKLYGLSILDPLTSLHNRRFGEERLKEEMARAERNSDPLGVITLDLDHFKEINDQYGHLTGDLALKEFSRRLRRAIRACDVPVRIGGDEFLVILPECPREKVDVILSRLTSIEIDIDSQKLPVRYSVGRAHYQVSDTIESLLARADAALYEQKNARPERPPSGEVSASPSLAAETEGDDEASEWLYN
jgi:diguanylate cyclase (GGDEF)-like protein